jgi:molybdopterin-biosynthesis enzyme MoeA-like protein
MTYESISKAFDKPLVYHEPTMELMKKTFNVSELNEGQRRMAYVPSPDLVMFTPDSWVPLVLVKNVLILPGVPRLFQAMLDNWFESYLPSTGLKVVPKIRVQVKTDVRESILAARLAELQKEADGHDIEIGSYPKMPLDGKSYVVLSLVGPTSVESEIGRLTSILIREFDGTLYEE